MKRIGVIGMFHETNSFAPGLTEWSDFEGESTDGLDALLEANSGTSTTVGGFIDAIRSHGMELAAGFCARTTPSATISAEAGETILRRVVASIPDGCDALAISLHGAMVSQAHDDMEGELLSRIREAVGERMPIAVTIDLHANVTSRMVEHASLIVGFDTYPHIDMYDRAVEIIGLLARQLNDEIAPVMALAQPGLLVAPEATNTIHEGPMKELMEMAFKMEKHPGVLNVTVCGGFPYSDVADAGLNFLVTTDGDKQLAERLVRQLKEAALAREGRFVVSGSTVEEALREAAATTGKPVVLIEGADNVGGGTPGDATHILARLIGSPLKSLIVVWDKEAALQAARLGPGANFHGKIGGKTYALGGEPVEVQGTIRTVTDGRYQHIGPFRTGAWSNMGRTAVLETGNVTVILTEKRTTPRDVNQVLSVGLDPAAYDVIVVKAAVAWRTAFGDLAKRAIHVDTPGCCTFNLDHFTYRKAIAHPCKS